MGDETAKGLTPRDPRAIRNEMRDTRASLTHKLEALENRVEEKVGDIQCRVEETVTKVKDSVHDTFQTVKETLDWRHQMNEHPWAMFGGAVLAGFVVSGMLGPKGHPSGNGVGSYTPGAVIPPPEKQTAPGTAIRPHLIQKAVGQLNNQVERLEHAAISAASDFAERLITHAIPGLGRHLRP
jgi:ElaB/YqjD/DUF883 family membrane-anchored ribosome-binding protein